MGRVPYGVPKLCFPLLRLVADQPFIKGRKLVDITMSSAVGRKKAGPPISWKSYIGAICADCRVEVKERPKKTTNVWVVLLILNKPYLPRSQMGSHPQPN